MLRVLIALVLALVLAGQPALAQAQALPPVDPSDPASAYTGIVNACADCVEAYERLRAAEDRLAEAIANRVLFRQANGVETLPQDRASLERELADIRDELEAAGLAPILPPENSQGLLDWLWSDGQAGGLTIGEADGITLGFLVFVAILSAGSILAGLAALGELALAIGVVAGIGYGIYSAMAWLFADKAVLSDEEIQSLRERFAELRRQLADRRAVHSDPDIAAIPFAPGQRTLLEAVPLYDRAVREAAAERDAALSAYLDCVQQTCGPVEPRPVTGISLISPEGTPRFYRQLSAALNLPDAIAPCSECAAAADAVNAAIADLRALIAAYADLRERRFNRPLDLADADSVLAEIARLAVLRSWTVEEISALPEGVDYYALIVDLEANLPTLVERMGFAQALFRLDAARAQLDVCAERLCERPRTQASGSESMPDAPGVEAAETPLGETGEGAPTAPGAPDRPVTGAAPPATPIAPDLPAPPPLPDDSPIGPPGDSIDLLEEGLADLDLPALPPLPDAPPAPAAPPAGASPIGSAPALAGCGPIVDMAAVCGLLGSGHQADCLARYETFYDRYCTWQAGRADQGLGAELMAQCQAGCELRAGEVSLDQWLLAGLRDRAEAAYAQAQGRAESEAAEAAAVLAALDAEVAAIEAAVEARRVYLYENTETGALVEHAGDYFDPEPPLRHVGERPGEASAAEIARLEALAGERRRLAPLAAAADAQRQRLDQLYQAWVAPGALSQLACPAPAIAEAEATCLTICADLYVAADQVRRDLPIPFSVSQCVLPATPGLAASLPDPSVLFPP